MRERSLAADESPASLPHTSASGTVHCAFTSRLCLLAARCEKPNVAIALRYLAALKLLLLLPVCMSLA